MLPWSHNPQTSQRKLYYKPQCPAAWSFPCLDHRLCTTPKTLEQGVSKGRLCPGVRAPEPGQLWELSASSTGVHAVHFIGNVISDGVQLVLLRILSHAPEALTPEASQGTQAWWHTQPGPPPPPCAHLGTVPKALRLFLPEPAMDLTYICISDSSRTTQKQKEEKCQTTGIKLEQTKSHAFWNFESLEMFSH